MNLKKSKALISLITLFFLVYFLLIMYTQQSQIKNHNRFTNINLLDTKKQIEKQNIEQIIKNKLNTDNENTVSLKLQIDQEIYKYIKNSKYKWYLQDIITKKKEDIDLVDLQKLSKLIIFKPSKKLVIKKYTLTNSINKNLFLNLEIDSKNLISKYTFPENYYVIEYVYK